MSDELLDIVDDEDRVTGQAIRAVVHQRGLQHRGVHVFLVTPERKLLVQQRSRQRGTAPASLDCSVSEHVKAGEDYSQAVVRGLAEELGLQDIAVQPLIKFKMDYGPNDPEICQLFEGEVDPALVRFDPVEIEWVASYSLAELETLFLNERVAFSGWFVQLIRWYLGRTSRLQVLQSYSSQRLLLPG